MVSKSRYGALFGCQGVPLHHHEALEKNGYIWELGSKVYRVRNKLLSQGDDPTAGIPEIFRLADLPTQEQIDELEEEEDIAKGKIPHPALGKEAEEAIGKINFAFALRSGMV